MSINSIMASFSVYANCVVSKIVSVFLSVTLITYSCIVFIGILLIIKVVL